MKSSFPIPTLQRVDGQLKLEGLSLTSIAERFGTPTYEIGRAHV